MYHGFSDGDISTVSDRAVLQQAGGAQRGECRRLQKNARLFHGGPEMAHCSGGAGSESLRSIHNPAGHRGSGGRIATSSQVSRDGVEKGEAPAQLIATKYESDDIRVSGNSNDGRCASIPPWRDTVGRGDVNRRVELEVFGG